MLFSRNKKTLSNKVLFALLCMIALNNNLIKKT